MSPERGFSLFSSASRGRLRFPHEEAGNQQKQRNAFIAEHPETGNHRDRQIGHREGVIAAVQVEMQ